MTRRVLVPALLLALASIVVAAAGAATLKSKPKKQPVTIEVFAPGPADVAGKASKGFFVDLSASFPSLASSGANYQLTGPKAHANTPPYPGAFGLGHDDKLPGLIVLLSTTTVGAHDGQNLAGLFNLTGFTNAKSNEIWDTWIAGDSLFGRNVHSVLRVAVAADVNHDGVYNDAPDALPDANGDGHINTADLKAFGIASNIVTVPFEIRD